MSDRFRGRREDLRFVTGAGRYTNDWSLEGQAYAAFRRSERAHALIRSIDASAAKAHPGVIAVFTGTDVADWPFATLPPIQPPPGRDGQKLLVPDRPVLARDRVRFVGEEIALVVAESAGAARDAADLIEVEYEDLPVVIGFDAALRQGAPVLHDNIPGNVCFEFEYGDAAATEAAFARAHGTARVVADSPRVAPTPMEVRGILAAYDASTGRYDVWCANQGNAEFAHLLSIMSGIPQDKLRVNMLDVGGAFGARTAPFPEYPLLLHVAKHLGRPVKWLSTRSEDFLTDNHGRAVSLVGELAYDKRGKFLAIRTEWLCDSGAYLGQAGALTNSINGRAVGAGVYKVEAFYGHHRQVMTNTSPTNAYRGAGRPEANFIIERLVDEAASKLGVDAMELRRRNLVPADAMPFETPTGGRFDSGDFSTLLEGAREASDWNGFGGRRKQSKKNGTLRGIGVGMFIEPSGGGGVKKDEVAVFFQADGTIVIHNVAGPSGQGHETVFPNMIAGWLGIPAERIICKSGDPNGPTLVGAPSIGSRSGFSQGSAYKIASEIVIEKAKRLAADMLEAHAEDIVFADGTFTIVGTDQSVAMTAVLEKHAGEKPHPLDTIAERSISVTFPSGAHVAEVEIDPQSGHVDIVRYTAVDDIGTVLNATLADGQLIGGVVQGASHVFGEDCRYDPADGQLITGSFMDYRMARADLLPHIETVHRGVPTPTNPLGAKGVGEAGSTGAMVACFNAVMDALRSAGVQSFDIPATPPRIWAALTAARHSEQAS